MHLRSLINRARHIRSRGVCLLLRHQGFLGLGRDSFAMLNFRPTQPERVREAYWHGSGIRLRKKCSGSWWRGAHSRRHSMLPRMRHLIVDDGTFSYAVVVKRRHRTQYPPAHKTADWATLNARPSDKPPNNQVSLHN